MAKAKATTMNSLDNYPKNILFVCTGNQCRSVMAEGLLKKILLKEDMTDISIYSAGTNPAPKQKPSLNTLELLKKDGLDFSHHISRRLSIEMIEEANAIFVMQRVHKDAVLKIAPHAGEKICFLSHFHTLPNNPYHELEIPDPIGMNLFFYENIYEMIRSSCQGILRRLKQLRQSVVH